LLLMWRAWTMDDAYRLMALTFRGAVRLLSN
jgi:hypothetical protein